MARPFSIQGDEAPQNCSSRGLTLQWECVLTCTILMTRNDAGRTLLHPFEDHDVIAGQGTAALELAKHCEQIGVEALDAFLVCTGGGGLTAGCCTVLKELMPSCNLYSVEPEA